MEPLNICPRFEQAINMLGKRWTGLIIHQLLDGPKRFSVLEASTSISGRVLSDRLKDLEQNGVVKRNIIPESPVRIEYSLTDKGLALEPILREIENWSQNWIEQDQEEQIGQ
ncbi:helix-turn-helix transcriptional regulator [Metabacillus sp. KIGAM252]|uniref:Helix-turn-helix transcriptional regulator n=1 Tax=Metabacillus flavus TaxID=2823519 RepID=A0ABS5LAF8_9BACI|nr:helix-turn-helix domain-containing protein [Metabacillus flavus]MBS2967707.1 helix-turn-helix transcriptional regulator [Metabacillus flavus]